MVDTVTVSTQQYALISLFKKLVKGKMGNLFCYCKVLFCRLNMMEVEGCRVEYPPTTAALTTKLCD